MGKNNATIIREVTKIVCDEKGEKKSERTEQYIRRGVEPRFVKLYLDCVLVTNELPKRFSPVLVELLKYMNYVTEEGQLISLTPHIRKHICTKLGISSGTLRNKLIELCSSDIMRHIGSPRSGTYVMNPHIFGKGDWKDIQQIRSLFTFSPDKTSIETNITTSSESKGETDFSNASSVRAP